MHEIDDLVVHNGKLVLSQLPYADGQLVRVVVFESDAQPRKRLPIQQIRNELRGSVEHFDEPLEPMIPPDDWEMLK